MKKRKSVKRNPKILRFSFKRKDNFLDVLKRKQEEASSLEQELEPLKNIDIENIAPEEHLAAKYKLEQIKNRVIRLNTDEKWESEKRTLATLQDMIDKAKNDPDKRKVFKDLKIEYYGVDIQYELHREGKDNDIEEKTVYNPRFGKIDQSSKKFINLSTKVLGITAKQYQNSELYNKALRGEHIDKELLESPDVIEGLLARLVVIHGDSFRDDDNLNIMRMNFDMIESIQEKGIDAKQLFRSKGNKYLGFATGQQSLSGYANRTVFGATHEILIGGESTFPYNNDSDSDNDNENQRFVLEKMNMLMSVQDRFSHSSIELSGGDEEKERFERIVKPKNLVDLSREESQLKRVPDLGESANFDKLLTVYKRQMSSFNRENLTPQQQEIFDKLKE